MHSTGLYDASADRRVTRVAWLIASLVVGLHVIINLITPYEIHRDELLYAAMGRHLSLFRMDFPPLIAMIAEAERALVGDTLWGLRLVPALLHGALVVLTARIAIELGGDRRAQWLGALAVALTPLMMRAGALFQPVILDQVAWTAGYLALAGIARTSAPRWWITLGIAMGLGLLAKFSIAFFGFGIVVAVLLTPHRRALLTRWPWIAAALALLIGAPSVIGQVALDWPVQGQMQDLQAAQLAVVTPAAFLSEQLLYGPVAWLGIAGLVALLLAPALRPWRVLAIATLATTVLLLMLKGKAYYLGPIWPALAAAGATWLRAATRNRFRAVVPVAAAVIVAFGAFIGVPLGLPLLPKEEMAAYARRLGLTAAVTTNRGEVAELPQDFADMLGWEAFVQEVARAWQTLPEDDRATAVLAATNYGRAGAIDWYGPRHGLPSAVCACGSYWFWGPGERRGDLVMIAGGTRADVEGFMSEVTQVGNIDDPWRVGEEQSVPVWLARGWKVPLDTLWMQLEGRN